MPTLRRLQWLRAHRSSSPYSMHRGQWVSISVHVLCVGPDVLAALGFCLTTQGSRAEPACVGARSCDCTSGGSALGATLVTSDNVRLVHSWGGRYLTRVKGCPPRSSLPGVMKPEAEELYTCSWIGDETTESGRRDDLIWDAVRVRFRCGNLCRVIVDLPVERKVSVTVLSGDV